MRSQDEKSVPELLSGASDIAYAFDLGGNITFLNDAGQRALGYSCVEARRMNITEVVAPEFADQIRGQISRTRRDRLGAVYEIDLIAKDGRRIPFEVSMRVIIDGGKPIEVHGIAIPSVIRGHAPLNSGPSCVDADFVWINYR
jgi:HTH-type transcriptional regulator, bacterioopsin transcriptional activator and related proteins